MALYPTLEEAPFITLGQSIDQRVLRSNFDDLGKVQVKRKWLYPRRKIMLEYSNILNSEVSELEQFYISVDGPYQAFTFIMPLTESNTYVGEYVGTADGSQTVWNLPFKSGSGISIYVDGSEDTIAPDETSAGNCYITESGGQDGVDTVTFFTAPSSGVRLTTDFTGRLAVRCRFAEPLEYSRNRTSIAVNALTVSLTGTLIDE